MSADAERWDARYREENYPGGTEPSPFLREILPVLPCGCALDLACGAGRNAVFLAAYGWRVIGMDSSRVALERAAALASQRAIRADWASPAALGAGAEVTLPGEGSAQHAAAEPGILESLFPKTPGLLLVETHLEKVALPEAECDLLICFNYLQRSLFPAIERFLRPGGMLVYETLTIEQLTFAGGPRNPEHLLQPGELRSAFPGLETLFFRQLCAGKGIASLLARKPAARH